MDIVDQPRRGCQLQQQQNKTIMMLTLPQQTGANHINDFLPFRQIYKNVQK